MVRTGSHGYIKYGWEGATHGALASGETADKKFGLQDRLSSLSISNNRQNLGALNQNTLQNFAYGQQQGTASVGFVLANPWLFGALLGEPSKTGSNPYVYVYPHASNGINKEPRTIQVEVGFDGASADIVRTLKGCLVNSMSISAAVGGMVECTAEISFGKESEPSASLGSAPSAQGQEFPYTFAHAELTVGGQLVAQCQDANINLSQNSELLYGLNSHQAVSSYRRILDITGSFRASWIDKDLLIDTLKQIKEGGNSAEYKETVAGSPEFQFTFIKNATNEKIIITGTGLSVTDHALSGFEPVEPIFEEINWQMKTVTVTATNTSSAEE
jgi:hypothetical protein|tara:strand:- start:442 stop:1431 length:990 start_codon:yes stop_codon:yes gene_type:complete